MRADEAQSRHYATVARAIAFIRAHAGCQPALEEIAAAVHLSPWHLQRVFAAWAGISPKRFLQYLTKEYARRQLATADVLSVSAAAGLGSGSRLHDLMVSCEAMTPLRVGSVIAAFWTGTRSGRASPHIVAWVSAASISPCLPRIWSTARLP